MARPGTAIKSANGGRVWPEAPTSRPPTTTPDPTAVSKTSSTTSLRQRRLFFSGAWRHGSVAVSEKARPSSGRRDGDWERMSSTVSSSATTRRLEGGPGAWPHRSAPAARAQLRSAASPGRCRPRRQPLDTPAPSACTASFAASSASSCPGAISADVGHPGILNAWAVASRRHGPRCCGTSARDGRPRRHSAGKALPAPRPSPSARRRSRPVVIQLSCDTATLMHEPIPSWRRPGRRPTCPRTRPPGSPASLRIVPERAGPAPPASPAHPPLGPCWPPAAGVLPPFAPPRGLANGTTARLPPPISVIFRRTAEHRLARMHASSRCLPRPSPELGTSHPGLQLPCPGPGRAP